MNIFNLDYYNLHGILVDIHIIEKNKNLYVKAFMGTTFICMVSTNEVNIINPIFKFNKAVSDFMELLKHDIIE